MRTTFTEIKVGEKIRVPIQTEDDQQASLEVCLLLFVCFCFCL